MVSVDLDFEQFRVFLEKTCGILLGSNKQYLVSSRLNKLKPLRRRRPIRPKRRARSGPVLHSWRMVKAVWSFASSLTAGSV